MGSPACYVERLLGRTAKSSVYALQCAFRRMWRTVERAILAVSMQRIGTFRRRELIPPQHPTIWAPPDTTMPWPAPAWVRPMRDLRALFWALQAVRRSAGDPPP